jgi:Icc-related predicted phosphoesterase
MKITIALIHAPPYNTVIDKAPELTKNLRHVTKGADALMRSVGSVAFRSLMEEYSPMLDVHGHVH